MTPESLAGRLRISTFGPYVSYLGYDPAPREADTRQIYCDGPDIAANVTANTIPTADPTLLQTIAPQGPVALSVINAEVTRQALFIAYLDDFKLMMYITLLAVPMLLLLRTARQRAGSAEAPVME